MLDVPDDVGMGSTLLIDVRASFRCAHTLTPLPEWQCRRNDATELAHADMTTLAKMDTNCTALSLLPAIIGNTFAASLRTDICPQRK
jgi:hypothetical protein